MTRQSAPEKLVIGMDVGSTTVKAVVVDPDSKEILWSDYQRNQTKQPEMVLEFLERIEAAFPNVPREKIRTFIKQRAHANTGSTSLSVVSPAPGSRAPARRLTRPVAHPRSPTEARRSGDPACPTRPAGHPWSPTSGG